MVEVFFGMAMDMMLCLLLLLLRKRNGHAPHVRARESWRAGTHGWHGSAGTAVAHMLVALSGDEPSSKGQK